MNMMKKIFAVLMVAISLALLTNPMEVFADNNTAIATEVEVEENNSLGDKALAAALCVGLAAGAGAIAMGLAIAKSSEGISRQPEAEGKIRTSLMLGLVFIETAIIYALIVAILIIFVL